MQDNEIRLRPVSYADLSSLQHQMLVFEAPEWQTPEFLVIRYGGTYRAGAAGRADALYMVAAAAAAREAWFAESTILDLQGLEYTWGDEMEWFCGVGWDRASRCHAPLAIVVGERCRSALRTLLREEYDRWCVETMEEAVASCRRQGRDYRQCLESWRLRVVSETACTGAPTDGSEGSAS
jgi:hypothetical protein